MVNLTLNPKKPNIMTSITTPNKVIWKHELYFHMIAVIILQPYHHHVITKLQSNHNQIQSYQNPFLNMYTK